MNIKQASEQSGVSAPNIRFYEKEGLLTPARRQGNDYRDYTAGDVRTLKLIRMLRMLDVPLPTIKAVLRGEQPLQQALQAQQTVLEQQAAHLAAAMQFCADLARQRPQAETLDVDACLTRMEKPAVQGAFCSGWLQDYRTLAQVQHQRHFSFIPEGSINTPQEFTAALQTYAKANGMQFSLEKEGMYPEFRWTISRIKLTATRASTGMRSAAMPCIPSSWTPGFPPGGRSCCASRVSCCRRCAPLPPSWRQGG